MYFADSDRYISGFFKNVISPTKSDSPNGVYFRHWLRGKRVMVVPAESLDRNDMTHHSRVYQISFWQMGPVWGGIAWWWEKIEVENRAAWCTESVPWPSSQQCLWGLPEGLRERVCLCAISTRLLIFLEIGRRVMPWIDYPELYTSKNEHYTQGYMVKILLEFIWSILVNL